MGKPVLSKDFSATIADIVLVSMLCTLVFLLYVLSSAVKEDETMKNQAKDYIVVNGDTIPYKSKHK